MCEPIITLNDTWSLAKRKIPQFPTRYDLLYEVFLDYCLRLLFVQQIAIW